MVPAEPTLYAIFGDTVYAPCTGTVVRTETDHPICPRLNRTAVTWPVITCYWTVDTHGYSWATFFAAVSEWSKASMRTPVWSSDRSATAATARSRTSTFMHSARALRTGRSEVNR